MASKISEDDVKKGMTCLVLDPETKELEPAVVCKVPKHRRWVHTYLEIAHRKLKKVPIGELYKRPEDFEYEENIGQIPLFEAHVSDDDPVDSNVSPDVETEKGGKPTDEATSAISSSTTVALKKGDLCLVQHEDDQWQPGVIVKVPKHGRWFHIYLELQHRRLKRISAEKIVRSPHFDSPFLIALLIFAILLLSTETTSDRLRVFCRRGYRQPECARCAGFTRRAHFDIG